MSEWVKLSSVFLNHCFSPSELSPKDMDVSVRFEFAFPSSVSQYNSAHTDAHTHTRQYVDHCIRLCLLPVGGRSKGPDTLGQKHHLSRYFRTMLSPHASFYTVRLSDSRSFDLPFSFSQNSMSILNCTSNGVTVALRGSFSLRASGSRLYTKGQYLCPSDARC